MPRNCGEFQITNCADETMLPWILFAGGKNVNFDQARTDLFTVLFILVIVGSQYKSFYSNIYFFGTFCSNIDGFLA